MSFFIYDIIFLIIFSTFIIIFLYKNRKNLKREGIIYLYKTKIGIKLINFIGDRHKKTLKIFSFISVACGYVLMISMLYLLGKLIFLFFKFPGLAKAIKVPPLMPLIPYLPEIFKVDFLPPFYFTYWIIAIAIIAASHEFSHGIFARYNKVKIKSTGFGFLGPFLAAFVEPDEKHMSKKPIFSQIAILSAGSFANVVMTILFFIIFFVFFLLTFTQAGATFDTYYYQVANISSITSINGYNTANLTPEKILGLLENKKIDYALSIFSGNEEINLTEIKVFNETFFTDPGALKSQLEINQTQILIYDDTPAIKAGLNGIIIQINGEEIKNRERLSEELLKYRPGDKVNIKTKSGNSIEDFNLTLAENPSNKSKPYLGIAVFENKKSGISGFFNNLFSLFKKPGTAYEPKFNEGLIIFIYNLLWWIVLINISVALMNMLPVALFDGGRVFYLSMLVLVKKEKYAKKIFSLTTIAIVLALILLMLFWVLSFG